MKTSIDGILLYYKYFEVDDREAEAAWMVSSTEKLVGRVRVARDGVNATLGGSLPALREHLTNLQERRGSLDNYHLDVVEDEMKERVAGLRSACGFEKLSCRIVDEIVSFGVVPKLEARRPRRISLAEWDAAGESEDVLMVDVRNLYESAIGHFEGALLPSIRSTAEFESWLERHRDQFAGKRVFAYCTGGVRCENAGKLIAQHTECAEVGSLDGGILKYLREDGQNYKGRLFVFDPRASVPGTTSMMTRCEHCDDRHEYFVTIERPRCARCRVLILLCDNCRALNDSVHCRACGDKKE